MIDGITLTNKGLTLMQIELISTNNNLQTNTASGKPYYDNRLTKNLTDGVFIQIATDGKLKIECSLHKWNNRRLTGKGTNDNHFTMKQAKEAAEMLIAEKGIPIQGLNVYRFEIGLNLYMKNDCREYLDLMRCIEIAGLEKELLINQKFKDKRERTTEFHKDKRKYYKVYDKGHEMKDKKQGEPMHPNILRIETVYRRIEKTTFERFITPDHLTKIVNAFFDEWQCIKFDRAIQAPKGTGEKKKQLCKAILRHGNKTILLDAKNRHKKGTLTDMEYRGIREFISNDWQTFKTCIHSIQSEREKEFREQFNQHKKNATN